jgi:hypothetical protein
MTRPYLCTISVESSKAVTGTASALLHASYFRRLQIFTVSASRPTPHLGRAVYRARMRWADFETKQPRFAALGRDRLSGPGVVLVVTVRRDGSPRVSPVEPLFWNGDLWLSMGLGTMKARDLHRDPRVLVHSIVTSRDGGNGEFKVRGRAIQENDPCLNAQIAAVITKELGWRPEVGKFHLFRVAVDDVTFVHWDGRNNDQYLSRWPEGREQVRRGTSATSNGPPEPHRELLDR